MKMLLTFTFSFSLIFFRITYGFSIVYFLTRQLIKPLIATKIYRLLLIFQSKYLPCMTYPTFLHQSIFICFNLILWQRISFGIYIDLLNKILHDD